MSTKLLDCLGNELSKNDIVALASTGQIVWKVVDIKDSGQGPQLIRLVADLTIGAVPGQNIQNIAKVVSPSSIQIVNRLIDMSKKA